MTGHARMRRTAGALVAGVFALGLLGCAPDLPQPEPDAVPAVPPPALTLEQTDRVLVSVASTLEEADKARDAAIAKRRLSGPALAIRAAEYTVEKAVKGTDTFIEVPTKVQTVIVPETESWPRTVIAVSEQPEDLQSPRLLLLRQEGPRSTYKLWAWARMLPGAVMPLTSAAETGSAPLALDTQGLVVAPSDVADRYADVLVKGSDSEHASLFEDKDRFRESIAAARKTLKGFAKDAGGKYTETITPDTEKASAVQTTTGGAIVVVRMNHEQSISVDDGYSIQLPAADAALLGSKEIKKKVTYLWTDVVAFYVPPSGAGETIHVLAVEHFRTDVKGS